MENINYYKSVIEEDTVLHFFTSENPDKYDFIREPKETFGIKLNDTETFSLKKIDAAKVVDASEESMYTTTVYVLATKINKN